MKKIYVCLFSFFLLSFGVVEAAPEIKQDVVAFLKPKLNSDRIEYFFGSYGVEPIQIPVILPVGESRVSNLYSTHDGEKVMRTLAVVNFEQPVHENLRQVHKEIIEGKSIGIALRENGWMIEKHPVYFGSISLPLQLQKWMHESCCQQAAVHIYQLQVSRGDMEERLPYCTIIEVHSPQYLDEKWLQALYFEQYWNFNKRSKKINVVLHSLQVVLNNLY